MKKILLSFSFIALFGLVVTSLSFDFTENTSIDNKINLENKEEKASCCNTEKSTELINDNLPAKKACCSKKPF